MSEFLKRRDVLFLICIDINCLWNWIEDLFGNDHNHSRKWGNIKLSLCGSHRHCLKINEGALISFLTFSCISGRLSYIFCLIQPHQYSSEIVLFNSYYSEFHFTLSSILLKWPLVQWITIRIIIFCIHFVIYL